MALKDSLARLFAILEQKTGRSRAELGFAPGASKAEIAELAAVLPDFPPELGELLLVVNGQDRTTPILPAAWLQSAESILAEWEDLCSNVDEERFGDTLQDEDRVKWFLATKKWIPLAWDYEAGGGVYHYIDLDPGPQGKVGQVLEAQSECDFQVLVGSLPKLFERLADAFEQGALYFKPNSDGGLGLWWDTEEYWQTVGE